MRLGSGLVRSVMHAWGVAAETGEYWARMHVVTAGASAGMSQGA